MNVPILAVLPLANLADKEPEHTASEHTASEHLVPGHLVLANAAGQGNAPRETVMSLDGPLRSILNSCRFEPESVGGSWLTRQPRVLSERAAPNELLFRDSV